MGIALTQISGVVRYVPKTLIPRTVQISGGVRFVPKTLSPSTWLLKLGVVCCLPYLSLDWAVIDRVNDVWPFLASTRRYETEKQKQK